MKPTSQPAVPFSRRLAWDGFSFHIPEYWDLSGYRFGRTSVLELQDDTGIRLQCEWTRLTQPPDGARLRQKAETAAQSLARAADSTTTLQCLPPGWTGMLAAFPEQKTLAVAFWLSPRGDFFCVFKLHFEGSQPLSPRQTTEAIAASFLLHDAEPLVPWEFYDVRFSLGREFRLAATSFEAGRKLAAFQWRLRRLYLWQFSLADLLLRDRTPAAWSAGFLNNYKGIRGLQFSALDDFRISVRRKPPPPFLPYEEIGRGCFRWQAACDYVKERNVALLAVFNYRRPADLDRLRGALVWSDDLVRRLTEKA